MNQEFLVFCFSGNVSSDCKMNVFPIIILTGKIPIGRISELLNKLKSDPKSDTFCEFGIAASPKEISEICARKYREICDKINPKFYETKEFKESLVHFDELLSLGDQNGFISTKEMFTNLSMFYGKNRDKLSHEERKFLKTIFKKNAKL